jgi:hypothetical protein
LGFNLIFSVVFHGYGFSNFYRRFFFCNTTTLQVTNLL